MRWTLLTALLLGLAATTFAAGAGCAEDADGDGTVDVDDLIAVVLDWHGHGDGQFFGQPNTTVVGTSQSVVANFFGITNWPKQIVEYDLGGRVIDIIFPL